MNQQPQEPITTRPFTARAAIDQPPHADATAYTGAAALTATNETKVEHGRPAADDWPPAVCLDGANLIVTGDIDLNNAAQIEAAILPHLHDTETHLDLTAVDFIDSMGLTVLLRIYTHTAKHDTRLRITCSPPVYSVLAMTGLTGYLPGLIVNNAQPA